MRGNVLAVHFVMPVLGSTRPRRSKKRETLKTFAELARLYIERHAKIKKRSWAEDERIVNSELIPAWGHRKAADIARKDVIAVLDRIVERGAGVMANRTRALISKLYNFAIFDRGMGEHNQAYKVANPGEEHRRDRGLTQTEIRALWTALEKHPDPISAVFKLALLTALRRGEVLGMAWTALDLDAGWWTNPGRARQEQTRPGVDPLS
jgi:integrase